MNINNQKHRAVGVTVHTIHNVHNLHATELIRRATSLGILLYIKPPISANSKIRVVNQANHADGESPEVAALKSEISAAIAADRQSFISALIDHYREELAESGDPRKSPHGRASASGTGDAAGEDDPNVVSEQSPAQAFADAIRRQGQAMARKREQCGIRADQFEWSEYAR